MRFILLAMALLGVVYYISNPQQFGLKHKIELSGNGRIAFAQPAGAHVDFSKISQYGANLLDSLALASGDSGAGGTATRVDTRVMSAIEASALTVYKGRLAAISAALRSQPEATAAQMQAATKACLPAGAPPQLVNYFSGLVQVVALTSELPPEQQLASFNARSAPLTKAMKAWLAFMPDADREANTRILTEWAARPKALVACHQTWLGMNQPLH
jgi:hypothetical protein